MNRKAIVEGKFYGEPEPGLFSYAKTRKLITEKVLNYERDDNHVFVGVISFNVSDDGFTLELRISRHKYTQESDGLRKEEAVLEVLDGLESAFGIGEKMSRDEIESMEKQGILMVGYFTEFKEEED